MTATANRVYTLDVNFQEGGSGVDLANIRTWDDANTQVINKTTDSNGDITPTLLTAERDVLTANAVSAAISEDNAVFTDETTDANNATANDVTLMPTPAAATDRFYIGYSTPFSQAEINVGTAGAGTYTLTWEYWNGATWSALTVEDGTDNFKIAGQNTILFTPPGDWATTSVNAQGPFYYIRCTRDAGTQTTQPLGTQIWATTLATTVFNPFVIRALKWGLTILEVSINLSAPSKQTLFGGNNGNLTETNQTLVQAYTGAAVNHTFDDVTLSGAASGTVVNNVDRLYDYLQNEAIVTPQLPGLKELLETIDKSNYNLFYNLILDAATNTINFDGQGRTINGFFNITVQNGAGITDITLGNDLILGVGTAGTSLTDVNITSNGKLTFSEAGTYTLTDCNIYEVENISGGAVTISAVGTTSITVNSGPNITIENNVPLLATARDAATQAPIQGARIILTRASDTAPTYQSVTSTAKNTPDALPFTFDMPATRPNGDLFILQMTALLNGGPTPIIDPVPGWRTIAISTNGDLCRYLGVRTGDSEPASYQATANGTAEWQAQVIRLSGTAISIPVNQHAENIATGSTQVAPAVTPDDNNTLVLRFCNRESRAFTVVPPTIIHNSQGGGGTPFIAQAASYESGPAAGVSTGTANFETSVFSGAYIADTLAINAARVELINELTDVNGEVSGTFNYGAGPDVPVKGRVRQGTNSPYFQTAPLAGTITSLGYDQTAFLVLDE